MWHPPSVWVPGCGGMTLLPCSAPGIPRSFRCAALAPPYAGAKGAYGRARVPAPGIPLRACFARTRPLSLGAKGDGVGVCG